MNSQGFPHRGRGGWENPPSPTTVPPQDNFWKKVPQAPPVFEKERGDPQISHIALDTGQNLYAERETLSLEQQKSVPLSDLVPPAKLLSPPVEITSSEFSSYYEEDNFWKFSNKGNIYHLYLLPLTALEILILSYVIPRKASTGLIMIIFAIITIKFSARKLLQSATP